MPKILLVEDNEMNRDMLTRRLEKRGYTISIAVDGAEGVAKAKAEVPDLILMDMSLPVLDGWDATKQVKVSHPMFQPLAEHLMNDKRAAQWP